jgi:hypothetical protein
MYNSVLNRVPIDYNKLKPFWPCTFSKIKKKKIEFFEEAKEKVEKQFSVEKILKMTRLIKLMATLLLTKP